VSTQSKPIYQVRYNTPAYTKARVRHIARQIADLQADAVWHLQRGNEAALENVNAAIRAWMDEAKADAIAEDVLNAVREMR